MFINAYQSYLFNKIISMRLTEGLPIDRAIPGDIIIPTSYTRNDTEWITATASNLDKVNYQIEKHKAVVSGILFGHSPIYAKGEMGEIENTIIENEGIDPRYFFIPEIPFLSSSGTRRGIFSWIKDLTVQPLSDSRQQDKRTIQLSFDLDKGCYATSFLREWMKVSDVRAY
jgi:tRNA pseudouridine13 synthase